MAIHFSIFTGIIGHNRGDLTARIILIYFIYGESCSSRYKASSQGGL